MPTVISSLETPLATVTLGWIYVEKKYLWSTVVPHSDHINLGGGFMWKKVFTGHRLNSCMGHRLGATCKLYGSSSRRQ